MLEAWVHSGQLKDYGELARRAQVSPARIAQIVILAQLAPEIQEYVLFLPAEHAARITEPQLRRLRASFAGISNAPGSRSCSARAASPRSPFLRRPFHPVRISLAFAGPPRDELTCG